MGKKIIVLVLLIAIIAAIFLLEGKKPEVEEVMLKSDTTEESLAQVLSDKAKKYELAKEITTPDGFINTEGISIGELIGKKVIMIDFWTYSCINCQRTFPYINAWYDKYQDQGLEIIGIHTPEFKFEHDYNNVVEATKRFELQFPIVQDNDFSTWRAYRNRFWPRKYIIDIDGFIVYDHAGEGAYEETEQVIQELLEERRERLGLDEDNNISSDTVEPADVEQVNAAKRRSPEVYFGASRNEYLANAQPGVLGAQIFDQPTDPKLNALYLTGEWDIQNEFAENQSAGAKITYRYQAEKVFMVLSSDEGVNVTLLRDGQPLEAESAGEQVELKNGQSSVFVQQDRLYRLIEDEAGHAEHTLEIIADRPGLKAFTFTFG